MKKAFLTIALAAFAFAANAQLFVGGNLGFNTNSGTQQVVTTGGNTTVTVDSKLPTSTGFYFMPKIGYQLNEKMAAGIILGYSSNTDVYTLSAATTLTPLVLAAADNFAGTQTDVSSTLTFTPFFRYNLMELNAFTLFCEAAIPIRISPASKETVHYEYDNTVTNAHVTVDEVNNGWATTSYGLTITPGLNYKFNEHLNMDLYFNAIGLGFTMTNSTRTVENNVTKQVTTQNSTDFGFNVRTLPNAVGFGINYVF